MEEGTEPRPEEIEAIRLDVLAAYKRHVGELSANAASLARNSALAQDILQETFLRYFLARLHGEEIADEEAWLCRVMRSLILDWRKSSQEQGCVALDDAGGDLAETTKNRQPGSLALAWISRTAQILAPREQECVNLRAQGLAYREIARAMQIDIGTVGALLNRAVRKLKRAQPIKENPE